MTGRYLLDTNIAIALFAGDSAVLEQLETAREIFVPSVVLGELCYGAWKSARPRDSLICIDDFASATTVLTCGLTTAQWYGRVKNDIRASGRTIPGNDIWIAAVAFEHGLTLVTRDGHFSSVPSFSLACW